MMSPRIPDKIIINDFGLLSFWWIIKGFFKGITEVLKGSLKMGQEIEENGWEKETEYLDFLKEQEADCADIDNACATLVKSLSEFHTKQMDRNNRMRVYIDRKLSQKP